LVSAVVDGFFQGYIPRVAQPLAFVALITQPLFPALCLLSHLHKLVTLTFDLSVLFIIEKLLIFFLLICSLNPPNSLDFSSLQLLFISSNDFLLPFLYLFPDSLFIKRDILLTLETSPGIMPLLFLLVIATSFFHFDSLF
jgi:hypothetical protein